MSATRIELPKPLQPGEKMVVVLRGREILLMNIEGSYHAFQNACPHAGAPLSVAGMVEGDQLYCEWHGIGFCLKDGLSASGFHLPVFPVTQGKDGALLLDLDAE